MPVRSTGRLPCHLRSSSGKSQRLTGNSYEPGGRGFKSWRARQRKRTGRAIRPDRFSFRLMSYAVLLHYFLPESKDVRIVRVDGRAYPMGVGMAERRDSREVL